MTSEQTHAGTLQPLCRCESRVFLVNVPDELVLHALGPFDHASLHLNELYTGPFGGGDGGRSDLSAFRIPPACRPFLHAALKAPRALTDGLLSCQRLTYREATLQQQNKTGTGLIRGFGHLRGYYGVSLSARH